MKCTICGSDATQIYRAYIDSAQCQNLRSHIPDDECLTGGTQVLSGRSGQTTFLEYDLPICRKCAYISQIRFNVIAALTSGILGILLLLVLSARAWGVLVLAFCAGNVAFGIWQFVKYLGDKPGERTAVAAVADHYNRGLASGTGSTWYTLEELKDDMGKLGVLSPGQMSKAAPHENNASPVAAYNKGSLPTCWVFACYDRERVQGMALFKGDFFAEENVMAMVRSRLKVPDFIEVKYVAPPAWEAPGITATATSFDCSMDEIDAKVNAYLVRTGYSADKPRGAMKTTIPYPNAGLLLIIVNLVA